MKLGVYKHFNGKLYEVLGVALDSETLDELVVYKALYDSEKFGNNSLWVRPKKMFSEKVIIGGKEVFRFTYIGESSDSSIQ